MEFVRKGSPVSEGWPNLMFLGLGPWWAWVWLCYTSTELARLFDESISGWHTFAMYMVSTVSIAVCMVLAVCFWKHLSMLFDRRALIIGGSLLAAVATLLIGLSAYIQSGALFFIGAFLSGIGTSVLGIKMGRVYASTSLCESLFSGGVALVFATLLYFLCIGVMQEIRLILIALLPLCSAAFFILPVYDPFPALVSGSNEHLSVKTPERVAYLRILAAFSMVSFTAGIGKGLCGLYSSVDVYSQQCSVVALCVGILALALCYFVNRDVQARSVHRVYAAMMMFGVCVMLASGFGVPLVFLGIGEELLHLIFICLLAYIVFKLDFSPIRMFALAQGTYFVSATVGWIVGALALPFYDDQMTRVAGGAIMALMVIVVVVFVLTQGDVKHIVEWSYEGAMNTESDEAVLSGVVLDPRVEETAWVEKSDPTDLLVVSDDGLARAREAQYGLSARELEVLKYFAMGRSANWIADHLVISKNTVRSHLRNIYTKLDVHTRQDLLDFLAGGKEPSP